MFWTWDSLFRSSRSGSADLTGFGHGSALVRAMLEMTKLEEILKLDLNRKYPRILEFSTGIFQIRNLMAQCWHASLKRIFGLILLQVQHLCLINGKNCCSCFVVGFFVRCEAIRCETALPMASCISLYGQADSPLKTFFF